MSDVTITNATINHALSATTPDDPAAEVQIQHWNQTHAGTIVLAAAAMLALFGNANGFTFDTSNGSIVGSYTVPNVPAQSVQTQPAGNIAGAGFTTTTAAGDKIAATQNSNGLLMAVPAYITTYAAQTVQTQASGNIARTGFTTTTVAGDKIAATHDTAGLLLAVPAYLTAAEGGGGAGTGFTTTTVGGAVVAGTLNTDGLLLAVPAYLTTQSVQTQASGNIPRTGFTTTTAGGSVIAGTHDTAGLLLAVPPYITTYVAQTVQTQNMVALHAHGANGVGTFTSGTLAIHAGNNVTLSTGAQALSIHAPAGGPGGGGATVSVIEIMEGERLTTCAQWNNATYSNRPLFIPFDADLNFAGCSTIRFMASRSSGTVLVATMFAGIYSRVNATSASLISSTSLNISHSTSALHSGVRLYDITGLGALSLPAGRYVLGLLASAAATNSLPLHLMGGDNVALGGFVLSGTNQSAATASNSHIIPFWGVYSTTSAGLPANIALSQVSGGASQNSPDIYAVLKAV